MVEVSASRKHPCPECGGDAEWNASKQALCCPYCGTILPWSDGRDPTGATISEHDLDATLATIPEQSRGFIDEKQSVKCESCHAISIFDPDRVAQLCEFCGSPSIIQVNDMRRPITPESVLPAVIPGPRVRESLREWYASRWWAPDKLKRSALTDTLHGIYLPYWTFDAHVEAQWTAESGYYYHVTEQFRGPDGKNQTRQVRKIRWENSAGSLSHFFDDDLVPGTAGVHTALLRKIEPFPTLTDLKPYEPAYVRGWTVERYQVDLRLASSTSKQQTDMAIRQLCSREVPGDTQRNLQISSRYDGRTFKHILVPVWLVSYNYGKRNFQVIVNGYTGKIAGEHPWSWIKITLAILAVILAVLVLVLLAN